MESMEAANVSNPEAINSTQDTKNLYDRVLPQDDLAEQCVLGAMLLSKDAIADVIECVVEEDFYRPVHQIIFNTILNLYAAGDPADPITVAARLETDNKLAQLGGVIYLHTLVSVVPTAANASYYSKIVAEKAVLRRLIAAGTKIVQLAYEGQTEREVTDLIDRAQAEIYEVTGKHTSEDFIRLEDLLQPTFDEIETIANNEAGLVGLPTGFIDLDKILNGLQEGQMIIIAARPGIGKSTLATDFLRSACIKQHQPGVIFSLEMSKIEIAMRLLSAEANVRLTDMRSGRMQDKDWSKLARRISEIATAPLFIDDSPNLTMLEIRAKARRLKQKHDIKIIVVDYIQLITSGKRFENRQQEVSEFSRQLKLLAKELNLAVVAISQLNRSVEQRTTKTPMISDLRESGSLEQDADIVLLLHRPDATPAAENSDDTNYETADSRREGEADIIIGKHRSGPTGIVTVAHQLHYSKFVDMARI